MKKEQIIVPDEHLEFKNSVGWQNLNEAERMELLESQGIFDIDIWDDPVTYQLQPNTLDYEQKRLWTRIKFRFANWLSHIRINGFIKQGMFEIKEIKGIENWKNVKTGAIVTCNHFSPTDTFIMQKVVKASKKKRVLKVVREGNYTNPPVLKFFLRNCGVLPLSSNMQTMREFLRAVENVLKCGDNILIYPEEAMWPNYKKPRPLKDGAFRFAVKNNVPVIPIFITMEDTGRNNKQNQPITAYTVHVLKPIYANKELDAKQNIENMKQENYNAWVNIYEDVYKEKVVYNIKDK